MTCAACVRRVEKGLQSLEGVRDASVNFASEKASVEFDPEILDSETIRDRVRELGYDLIEERDTTAARPGKTIISVGGMTCAACVRRVENALRKIPGVEDAAVNLATAKAIIAHAPNDIKPAAVEKVITDIGYEFLGIVGEDREDPIEASRRAELKELKLKVIAGIALSILIFMGSMQHWFPFLDRVPRQPMLMILLLLSIPAVFWVGSRFYGGAWKALRQKTSDMNTLVAMGSCSAFLYSAFATIWPGFFVEAGVAPHVYFDGAAMIVALVLLGRLLEATARGKTSQAVKNK